MYAGQHSVYFGDKNTWTDWYLIPDTRPVFNPPQQKTHYLDIPGANGSLDLSESLAPYPVFNDREGTMDFLVDNDHKEWHVLYSEIMDYLHGRRMRARLSDDPGYFYEGRFTVNEWRSEESNSVISIDYRVGPYKWAVTETQLLSRTTSSSTVSSVIAANAYGNAPVNPRLTVSTTVSQGMAVRFVNGALGIDETLLLKTGTHTPPEFLLYGGACTLYFTGAGSVQVYARKGGL